jgi:two-component system LytT family response regulator
MPENKTIKCLVADDEPAARNVLTRYIKEVPMLELVGECSNAIQVISLLQTHPIDLLFLDIHMPQLKGTDFLKALNTPPKTIFTTAYEQYALQSYELNALDYLLKPIQFHRFLKAVQKVMQLATPLETEQVSIQPARDLFIYFRANRKMVKVLLNDILYIESIKDYIKVFTTSGVIITKTSISSIEELLPENNFIRTHRSFIVSLQKVKSFTSEIIEIEKTEVPIGKMFRQNVLKILAK